MSATATEAKQQPSDLYSPHDQITKDMLATVSRSLSPEGWADFAKDLTAALAESKRSNDLRPLNTMIEAWYRTFVFMSRPQFHEAYASAETDDPGLSLADLRQRRAKRFA
jgi:hypothetical protein